MYAHAHMNGEHVCTCRECGRVCLHHAFTSWREAGKQFECSLVLRIGASRLIFALYTTAGGHRAVSMATAVASAAPVEFNDRDAYQDKFEVLSA